MEMKTKMKCLNYSKRPATWIAALNFSTIYSILKKEASNYEYIYLNDYIYIYCIVII
jgi:hypothetical protein